MVQVLSPIYEPQFSENSFGFRPNRYQHQAIRKVREYIQEGYTTVISIDLEKYFDTVNHSKLIQILSETIKDGRVISLIHKYLNAGAMLNGMFEKNRQGFSQGGNLSPLLSNVMLNELDKEPIWFKVILSRLLNIKAVYLSVSCELFGLINKSG